MSNSNDDDAQMLGSGYLQGRRGKPTDLQDSRIHQLLGSGLTPIYHCNYHQHTFFEKTNSLWPYKGTKSLKGLVVPHLMDAWVYPGVQMSYSVSKIRRALFLGALAVVRKGFRLSTPMLPMSSAGSTTRWDWDWKKKKNNKFDWN